MQSRRTTAQLEPSLFVQADCCAGSYVDIERSLGLKVNAIALIASFCLIYRLWGLGELGWVPHRRFDYTRCEID